MTFSVVYQPQPRIWCDRCQKGTRIVTDPDGTVSAALLGHYQRTHECGPQGEPWDLAPGDESAPAEGSGAGRRAPP